MSSDGIVCSQDRKAVHSKTCQKDSKSSSRSRSGSRRRLDTQDWHRRSRGSGNDEARCHELSCTLQFNDIKSPLNEWRNLTRTVRPAGLTESRSSQSLDKSQSIKSPRPSSVIMIFPARWRIRASSYARWMGYSIISCQLREQKANESFFFFFSEYLHCGGPYVRDSVYRWNIYRGCVSLVVMI